MEKLEMEKEDLKEIVGDWADLLLPLFNDRRMFEIQKVLGNHESKGIEWYPSKENVFRAFELCQLKDLKVIIIGQDPYHTPGVATGLAFGVSKGSNIPPSLRVIYNTLINEVNPIDVVSASINQFDTTLESWAKQGVLLLNTSLTVTKGDPGSHARWWRWFAEELIKRIEDCKHDIIIIRWGKHAQGFRTRYASLDGPHPMAQQYSGGKTKFIGYFGIVNMTLSKIGKEEIKWI